MIIFSTLFLGAFSLLTTLFGGLFAASEGFISLMTLLTLAFGALALLARQNWGWAAAFICILLCVGIEVLAPYQSMLVIVGSAVIAVVGTVVIKRPVLAYIRRDRARPVAVGGPRLRPWQHILLTWA